MRLKASTMTKYRNRSHVDRDLKSEMFCVLGNASTTFEQKQFHLPAISFWLPTKPVDKVFTFQQANMIRRSLLLFVALLVVNKVVSLHFNYFSSSRLTIVSVSFR